MEVRLPSTQMGRKNKRLSEAAHFGLAHPLVEIFARKAKMKTFKSFRKFCEYLFTSHLKNLLCMKLDYTGHERCHIEFCPRWEIHKEYLKKKARAKTSTNKRLPGSQPKRKNKCVHNYVKMTTWKCGNGI